MEAKDIVKKYGYHQDLHNQPDAKRLTEYKNDFIKDIEDFATEQSKVSDEEIRKEIFKHLNTLPYLGGYPGDWKETLSVHLGEWMRGLRGIGEWISDEKIQELAKEIAPINDKANFRKALIQGMKIYRDNTDSWIKLKKGNFPEQMKMMQLYDKNEGIVKGMWLGGKFSPESGEWELKHVSHYQPLPEPPNNNTQ